MCSHRILFETSAFSRVLPDTPPAENSGVISHRRDSNSHSDSGTMDHIRRTTDNGLNKTHSKTDGKGKRANDKETESNQQKTLTKPKLSFSVEGVMLTKTSSSSYQSSQHESQHSRSSESSLSAPSSDRYKENYRAICEACSPELDLISPPPPHPPHREGFEGLLGKAQGPFPQHDPFMATAGISKFKFCLSFKNPLLIQILCIYIFKSERITL